MISVCKKRFKEVMKKFGFDDESLDLTGWEDFVSKGIALTVRTGTAASYEARFKRFFEFCFKRSLDLELDSFVKFLSGCRKQGARGQTLEGYRCALVWIQRQWGMELWGATPMIIRAIKGYKYNDKQKATPRGAITYNMLEQLCELVPEMAVVMFVVFFCVLRVGQAARARFGDASFGVNGTTLLVRRDKRCNADNGKPLTAVKEILLPAGIELLKALAQTGKHGELMFPGFKAAAANAAIHRAAKHFKWPAGLEFDGMHCLRHGGAQELKKFIVEVLARMGPGAHMCQSTAQHYARLNELRVAIDEGESSSDEEADEDHQI